jgi:hypothetical protein
MSEYNPKDVTVSSAKAVPEPAPAPAVVAGPHFTIGVADKDGKEIPPNAMGFSDPCSREARGLIFDVHIGKDSGPTVQELDFYRELSKIEHALQELYPDATPANEARFRPYFVRLFFMSQLILEGDVEAGTDQKKKVGQRLSVDAAKAEIAAIASDLIDDEAPRVKNGHMRELAKRAGQLSLPFLGTYVVLLLMQPGPGEKNNALVSLMLQLGVDPAAAANFMLLWVGTFVGVCLSYAIRTHTFSLQDLTRSDSDYLAPQIRLLLAGAIATLLALFCIVGLGDVELGSVQLSDIAVNPMLAFVVGAVLGIGEKKLTGTIEKRTGAVLGSLDK